nr:hypothetical protein OG781_16405 [Streptomyces sp. NBC_00830]
MTWDDVDRDEDSRVLFGLDELGFGTENGLWPITSTDRGYLIGEDMAGPNSSAFYPGPVELQHLPMSADERPEHWCGPDRSIGAARTAALVRQPRRQESAVPNEMTS